MTQMVMVYPAAVVSRRSGLRRARQTGETLRERYLALLEAHQAQRTNVLMEIIEDGVRRGRFKAFHSALVAEIFIAAVNRINEPAMLERSGVCFSQAFDELFRILTTGLFLNSSD